DTAQAAVCQVHDNAAIIGSPVSVPGAVGLLCEQGGGGVVGGNQIIGAAGMTTGGVLLDRTGTVLRRNAIKPGCAVGGAGLITRDAYARIENNLIVGAQCGQTLIGESIGVRMVLGDSPAEIELHSNTIFGGGSAGICGSVGIDIAITDAGIPDGP